MKKILFVTLALLTAISTYAKDDNFTVLAGTPKALYQSGNATLKFDFSSTIVEHSKPLQQYLRSKGSDWVKDWPGDVKRAKEAAERVIKKKVTKKDGIAIVDGGGDMQLVVHVKNLDMGSTGGSIAGSFAPTFSMKHGGAEMDGTIELLKKGKRLFKVSFKEIKGDGTESQSFRLRNVFETLMKDFAKYANKYKGPDVADKEPESKPATKTAQQSKRTITTPAKKTSASPAKRTTATPAKRTQAPAKRPATTQRKK